MSSSNTEVNASGLTASESRALKERGPQPHEERIIKALKEMYTCNLNEDTFAVYTEDAVFHDPVGIADGVKSVRAQFQGLTKIFPRADIPKFRVLANPPSVPHNILLIDQDVSYFRDPSGSPTKTLNSLLTIVTNHAHQITRHTEEWNHSKQTTSEDGFLGMLNEQRKKLTAGLTNMVMGKDTSA